VREALMALALDSHFSKADLMNAYINEIFLGQDGDRAIHGFGLASQFYFGKSLSELDLSEVALLVSIVRGPSYYDPRRHPDRARIRRDLVLRLMVGPILSGFIIWLLGIQGALAQSLLISTSFPTAVNSALLAMEFDNEPEFAAAVVFYSTMFSAVTVSVVIYAAKVLWRA
jgi:hypothetical protein